MIQIQCNNFAFFLSVILMCTLHKVIAFCMGTMFFFVGFSSVRGGGTKNQARMEKCMKNERNPYKISWMQSIRLSTSIKFSF